MSAPVRLASKQIVGREGVPLTPISSVYADSGGN